MAEDSELWYIVLDSPHIPMSEVKEGDITRLVPKTRRKYNEVDRKKIEKNYRAKKILICGIGFDEYNCISACETGKEIWDCLRITYEGTAQVKESKIDILTKLVWELHNEGWWINSGNAYSFTLITNELKYLVEPISTSKQVRKVHRVLPNSRKSKVDTITEAKDLKTLTMDELIVNL